MLKKVEESVIGVGPLRQSCKNLGSVVALLQGNFEKIISLRQFLREKKTRNFEANTSFLVRLLAIKFDRQTDVTKSKNCWPSKLFLWPNLTTHK